LKSTTLIGFTRLGSRLAFKYKTRVEVTNALAYYDLESITAVKCFVV
jgi:hypothetical protein